MIKQTALILFFPLIVSGVCSAQESQTTFNITNFAAEKLSFNAYIKSDPTSGTCYGIASDPVMDKNIFAGKNIEPGTTSAIQISNSTLKTTDSICVIVTAPDCVLPEVCAQYYSPIKLVEKIRDDGITENDLVIPMEYAYSGPAGSNFSGKSNISFTEEELLSVKVSNLNTQKTYRFDFYQPYSLDRKCDEGRSEGSAVSGEYEVPPKGSPEDFIVAETSALYIDRGTIENYVCFRVMIGGVKNSNGPYSLNTTNSQCSWFSITESNKVEMKEIECATMQQPSEAAG